MGQCGGTGEAPSSKEVNLLLLGLSGSGKTTLTKQLRVGHSVNFEEWERESYQTILQITLKEQILAIHRFCEERDIDFSNTIQKRARHLLDPHITWEDSRAAINRMWADEGIQKGYLILKQNPDFYGSYFLSKLPAIMEDKYQLTDTDIVRLRFRTTGIVQTVFQANKKTWKICDAGGQLVERAKWNDIFAKSEFNGVLFLIAPNEYDFMDENGGSSRIRFSLQEFEKFWKAATKKTSCILIFNKIDVFKEKFKQDPAAFKKFFPDFKGETESNAYDYLFSLFKARIPPKIPFHCLKTCALEQDLTMEIFKTLQKLIVSDVLQATHLV